MASARERPGFSNWEHDLGRGPLGNADLDLEPVAVALPANVNRPVGALVAGFRPVESSAQARGDAEAAPSRLDYLKTSHSAVEPRADRAVSVVIEREHLAGVDRTVGLYRVPALRDRRRAMSDWIEPRRALFLEEERRLL